MDKKTVETLEEITELTLVFFIPFIWVSVLVVIAVTMKNFWYLFLSLLPPIIAIITSVIAMNTRG